jgi:heptosyltransferase-1
LLLLKTSSLGDLVHVLPALTDARRALPNLQADWVVEAEYAELPAWHPAVTRSLPVATRAWRRGRRLGGEHGPLRSLTALRRSDYDLVLDAQGLLKSAALAVLARGPRAGLKAPREPMARWGYQQLHAVNAHNAVDKNRQLFAAALGYPLPGRSADFGLGRHHPESSTLTFIHGSAWPAKRWPRRHWIELGRRACAAGFTVQLPAHSPEELAEARAIAAGLPRARVRASSDLSELRDQLASSSACVSVDSGPGQLAAALGVPVLMLFGATEPRRTGIHAAHVANLSARFLCTPCYRRSCRFPSQAACYDSIGAATAWHTLQALMNSRGSQRAA